MPVGWSAHASDLEYVHISEVTHRDVRVPRGIDREFNSFEFFSGPHPCSGVIVLSNVSADAHATSLVCWVELA